MALLFVPYQKTKGFSTVNINYNCTHIQGNLTLKVDIGDIPLKQIMSSTTYAKLISYSGHDIWWFNLSESI